MVRAVPIIDIAPYLSGEDPASVVRQVDEACRNTGFLVISGHGVSVDDMQTAVSTAKRFFSQPQEQKDKYTIAPARGGYQQFANMSLAQSHQLGASVPADLREGFSFDRPHLDEPELGLWGSTPDSALRESLDAYFRKLNGVADTLLEIFALALGKPENFFVPLNDHNASTLAMYHYPAMSEAPLPGQLRGGAHTDFGSITILFGEPSVQGLQIFADGEWHDAPIVPGTFVVNIGDLMQRWTNDLYASTLHRVANPVDGEWDRERFTIVYFHTPNTDALIESLDPDNEAKYPGILSGRYYEEKVTAMAVS